MKKVLAISSVLLGVVFLAGCGQKPVSQTQPTTPAPVAQKSANNQQVATQSAPTTAPVDETASWQTYSNASLGFTVSYPKNWKTMSLANNFQGISLSKDGNSAIFSVIYHKSVNDIPSEVATTLKNFDDLKKDPQYKDVKDITLLGNKAISATETNPNINLSETEIFISKGSSIYEISYDNNNATDISKQILTTFKFTK
jgi:PBP1b-binding outer membrane lipoprotein LpoB